MFGLKYICALLSIQMFPDNAVKREMASLQALCINPGCDWKGIFKQYEVNYSIVEL